MKFRHSKIFKILLAICYSLIISGCANSYSSKNLDRNVSNTLQESDWARRDFQVLDIKNATLLTERQKAHFLDYFYAQQNSKFKSHQRIQQYLIEFMDEFEYTNETFNASETIRLKRGDCLSLALVTAALADLVDVDVSHQHVNRTPLYSKLDGKMIITKHVRTKLYDKEESEQNDQEYYYFGRTHLIIDFFNMRYDIAGRELSREEVLSTYYSNLAVQAYTKRDYDSAFMYSSNAMKVYPTSPENINIHSLAMAKVLGNEVSISLMEKALRVNLFSLNLLENLKLKYQQTNQTQKLDAIDKKISYINDPNPYRWLDLGHKYYHDKKYGIALEQYQRAEKLAPYLDEVYFNQAKVYFKLGNRQFTKQYLRMAIQAPIKQNEISLYNAKLAILER
jgi:hypothetical protein